MSTLVQPPFPLFTDVDGDPLEDGYIYIGEQGLNPLSNPQQVYWDADLTVPAANIRTKGGYPVNAGSPSRLYTALPYSILVKNKRGSLVYSNLDSVDYLKIEDYVSVTTLGAKGDGITDDADAINAAAATNKNVYFPPGTYLVGSPIKCDLQGQSFFGDGYLATIKLKDGANCNIFEHTANVQLSYVEIKNLIVLGNKANNVSGCGVFGYKAVRWNIHDCFIGDVAGDAVYFYGSDPGGSNSAYANLVKDCRIITGESSGVHIGSWSSDNDILNCEIGSFSGGAFDQAAVLVGSGTLRINSCHLWGSTSGVYLEANVSQVVIANNDIETCGTGVYMAGANNNIVEACSIWGSTGAGVFFTTNAKGNYVGGCQIRDNGTYGIRQSSASGNVVDMCVFKNNTTAALNGINHSVFSNVLSYGAVGDGTTDDTVAINAALSVGGTVFMPNGVYLISTPLLPKSGSVLKGSGINYTTIKVANGANCNAIDNTSGALVSDVKIENLKIDGNKANNASGNGIRVYQATGWIIDGIKVQSTKEAGIYVVGDAGVNSTDNTIRNSLITLAGESGINIGGFTSSNNVDGCTVTGCVGGSTFQGGIQLVTSYTRVANCHFNGNAHGAVLNNGNHNTFVNCDFDANVGLGIWFSVGSFNVVESCRVRSNVVGIQFNNASIKNLVHGGSIHNNTNQGVKELDTATNNQYVGVLFEANGSVFSFISNASLATNCKGFNPQGVASVATGVSPWTYTNNDNQNEDVYLGLSAAGNITLITKNGTTIYTGSGVQSATVNLSPSDSVVVTYTGTLTCAKDRR